MLMLRTQLLMLLLVGVVMLAVVVNVAEGGMEPHPRAVHLQGCAVHLRNPRNLTGSHPSAQIQVVQ